MVVVPLFFTEDLREFLDRELRRAVNAIDAWDEDELRISPKSVVDAIIADFTVEPLVFKFGEIGRSEIGEKRLKSDHFGRTVEQVASAVEITIPFSGEAHLLRCRPSEFYMNGVDAEDHKGYVSFEVVSTTLTSDAIKRHSDRIQEQLRTSAHRIALDLKEWRGRLEAEARRKVDARKKMLDERAALNDELDIPIRSTAKAKRIEIPVRRAAVRLTSSGGKAAVAEPAMTDAIYEDVVRQISGLGRALERLPATASKFRHEEELRDLALFILNANFEGAVHGEVFNGSGKTDILLTHNNRNAFIGECKKWAGAAKFNAAIDQLLGYLIWQDTKAAIVLFIQQQDATAIIEKADQCVRSHRAFVSAENPPDPDARRDYVLAHETDGRRLIKVALLPVVTRPAATD